MPRYSLRTLLLVKLLGGPALAGVYYACEIWQNFRMTDEVLAYPDRVRAEWRAAAEHRKARQFWKEIERKKAASVQPRD